MNVIFKFLLTFNATFWMMIVYAINQRCSMFSMPYWLFDICLVVIVIVLSWISLQIFKRFGEEKLKDCEGFSLADNEFLPVYFGYFFVSLSISDLYTMFCLFSIVFVFTLLSQTQYFNPVYLLFGYHFYDVLTTSGTKIFVIARGKVIRRREELCFDHLRRINDTTFINIESR